MKLSIVLVDWGVRESFHTLRALAEQDAPRDSYEVIWVEWGPSSPVRVGGGADKVVSLSRSGAVSKHVCYNAGVLAADGELVCIVNSDDLMRPTFVSSILDSFTAAGRYYLHLDRADSLDEGTFPVDKRFPGVSINAVFDAILQGPAMYEYLRDKALPRGLVEDDAPHQVDGVSHLRDYGSCFIARRRHVLAFGGFDEHESYRSYWCGPYELAWRMQNAGWQEWWHPTEFTLGIWHPGVGASGLTVDERRASSNGLAPTAMGIRSSGRVVPLVMNPDFVSILERGL